MTGRIRRLLFGGCCAGQDAKVSGRMARDPVCGMDVDESKAAATSEYRGKTYYFCAVGCKKAFDRNPEKYLK
jgi:YHS domain-containing protein